MLTATRPRLGLRPLRLTLFLLVLGLVMSAFIGPAGIASAATSKRPACRPSVEVTCSIPAHVKRFKNGKYGRVHGVHVRLFASPAAKKALMMKLARKMPLKPFAVERSATCAKAPRWACAHGRTASRGGTRVGHERCMQSDACRAYNRYGALSRDATCFGVDSTYRRPACRPFNLTHPAYDDWHGFTKHQIQVAGSLTLCGAAVAFAVLGPGAWVAGTLLIGGMGCAWQLWRDVDPG